MKTMIELMLFFSVVSTYLFTDLFIYSYGTTGDVTLVPWVILFALFFVFQLYVIIQLIYTEITDAIYKPIDEDEYYNMAGI